MLIHIVVIIKFKTDSWLLLQKIAIEKLDQTL